MTIGQLAVKSAIVFALALVTAAVVTLRGVWWGEPKHP